MERVSCKSSYFEIIQKFDLIPFVQSEAWYNFLKSKNENLIFYFDSEKDTQIAFFGREKKIPFTSLKILIIDTPLINKGLTEKAIRKRFLTLIEEEYVGIELDSITEYDVEFEIGMRRAGFFRPLGFTKCPLTIILNLKEPFNFDTNWKRNVRKSSEAGIITKEVSKPQMADAQLFCRLFTEMKEFKNLKYSLIPQSIYSLLVSPNVRLFYAFENNQVISAQIIYVYNGNCYDIFRANMIKSRENNASYLLYDQIFAKLALEKHSFYDFGRIPPSNHATDSVYIFKDASRGRKVQYNGEWVYYKKSYFEDLIYLYKRGFLRKQRY